LPVHITEALTLSERSSTEITSAIDPSGWAWLVGGRKLFVWRYKNTKGGSRTAHCKELTLPPSDLAHSAERVCVIPSEVEGQPAACVAVSPEGVVRYWPKIAFESSTAEISAELKGEECARVINFQPHGVLLATTTSSLMLLQPTVGQPNITCKSLKSSQGMFSGISRRMSSFVFGAAQSQLNDAPLQAIIASHQDEYTDEDVSVTLRSFYVLSGGHLNKWQVPAIGPERLLYQVDVGRLLRESLAKRVWDKDSVQLPQLKTWLLDLQLTAEGVVVLGAGVNPEASTTCYYALAYLETYDDAQPANFSDLNILDFTQTFYEENENGVTNFRLLCPPEKSDCAFVYNDASILMLHDGTSDKMDLKTNGDNILGGGCCEGTAVFLSTTHGIFSVSPPRANFSMLDVSNNQSSVTRAELTSIIGSISKVAESSTSDDVAVKLKDIFIASIDGDQDQAQSLVASLLQETQGDPGARGSPLDHTVATVSRDLVDDYPSADPRWAEAGREEAGSGTASVIILQQLRDKEKAHDLFINFLKMYGVWSHLGIVTIRESMMPSGLLLCEHVEKLEAAIALRELHAQNHKMVDTCIRKLLNKRDSQVPVTLTPQDVFYREVSNVQDIVQLLLEYEQEELSKDIGSNALVTLVLGVNAMLEGMLSRALHYRQSHAEMYTSEAKDLPEYIPWTATSVVREAVAKQITISLEKAIPETREVDVQGILYQNVVGLSDILMDGYASQLKSLTGLPDKENDCKNLELKFTKERHRLIMPLLEHKQYDRAASLAEKFEDFELLMRICDATDNQERLQRYRAQYADKGFSQFVFNWYMSEGKRGHLLAQPVSQGEELSDFLNADNMRYLSWLHEIGRGNFIGAHTALSNLAGSEQNFLAKKKTLLSLSKLAALASDNADESLQDNIEAINEELELVMHQEQLPAKAVESVGIDPDNMRVLSPEELIELFVSEKNEFANELDVKKALDLLRYVDKSKEDSDLEALKLHIWSRAVLMNSWEDSNQTDPMESNKDKVFFKTVDLVYMEGELEQLLPPLDALMTQEMLGPLSRQPNFQFLMRGGYEQIQNVLSTSS